MNWKSTQVLWENINPLIYYNFLLICYNKFGRSHLIIILYFLFPPIYNSLHYLLVSFNSRERNVNQYLCCRWVASQKNNGCRIIYWCCCRRLKNAQPRSQASQEESCIVCSFLINICYEWPDFVHEHQVNVFYMTVIY